jgi:hypothetical protein
MPTQCNLCGSPVSDVPGGSPYQPRYDCRICGHYRLSERAAQRINELVHLGGRPDAVLLGNHHLLSAAIRAEFEESGDEVFVESFEALQARARAPANPFEAIDRVILHVARKAERAGSHIVLDPDVDYPIAFAKDAEEFRYYLHLGRDIGFLELEETMAEPPEARLAANGWLRLGELRWTEPNLRQAFVAMSFSHDMRGVYTDGFEPALTATGYESIRVDQLQYNEKVDDRIIAEIRRSGLVVGDFTGQRQNVYFEVGFAMGLGRAVICTCREDDVGELHFDIRQFNHVVWRDSVDLQEKLRTRIEATGLRHESGYSERALRSWPSA